MVAAGGNTRLQILRELRQEDEEATVGQEKGTAAKFTEALCVFKPYTSDIDILAAHLRENDLRDGLVFIAHAVAVVNLRRMLEEGRKTGQGHDGNDESWMISDYLYEKILREQMGHPISRRELGRMRYTAEVLWPVIPTALKNGASQNLIDNIGQIQNAYQTVYKEFLQTHPGTGSHPEFGTLFADSLTVHDDETLDLEAVKTEIDHRIAMHTGQPANLVRLALDEQLSNRTPRREPVPVVVPVSSAVP